MCTYAINFDTIHVMNNTTLFTTRWTRIEKRHVKRNEKNDNETHEKNATIHRCHVDIARVQSRCKKHTQQIARQTRDFRVIARWQQTTSWSYRDWCNRFIATWIVSRRCVRAWRVAYSQFDARWNRWYDYWLCNVNQRNVENQKRKIMQRDAMRMHNVCASYRTMRVMRNESNQHDAWWHD